jgi:hypothetical protein
VHTPRRRGRGQLRILYWFRTPPGVRVGRAAIDEDAIRLLEQHNPDVEFDWTRILRQPVQADQPPRPPQPPARERRRHERAPVVEPPREAPVIPPAELPPDQEQLEPDPPALQLVEEALLEEPVGLEPSPEPIPDVEVRVPAVAERVGAEGLARLRARYAEVMARIAERPLDDTARDELKLRAERLNPDAWVTAAEVEQGLEQYESVFESLRAVIGHPRRRRRHRPG